MRYDHAHPELAPVPRHTTLGPDPEPLGERVVELMRREGRRRLPARPPRVCPLSAAMGHRGPCTGADCIFFRVPGVPGACAVQHWSPDARDNRRLASWYLARRTDAALATHPGDATQLSVHTLATPGPGD